MRLTGSRIFQWLGMFVAAAALAILVGWALDIPALKRMVSSGVNMKANSAVAFLLCGIAVVVFPGRPEAEVAMRRLVRGLVLAVAGIAGLSLAQQVFSIDFRIDELLFLDPDAARRNLAPGRMSPSTALCFVAIATAMALATATATMRTRLPLAAGLSAAVVVVSGMVLLEHFSHKLLGYRWGADTTMAVPTTIGFIILGSVHWLRVRGLQTSPWQLGRKATAGFVAGMLLMLGATELAIAFVREMQTTMTAVVRAQQTLQSLLEIRNGMRAMEGAQRGHLINGGAHFLALRDAEMAEVRRVLNVLDSPARRDALSTAQLRRVSDAVEERIAYGDGLVERRRALGFEAARQSFDHGDDVALTARITQSIAPLMALEKAMLAERERRLQTITSATFLLLPLGAILGLAAMLAGLFYFDQGVGRRYRTDQALRRSQEELKVVFDNLSDGIRVVDEHQVLLQVNPAGSSIHGLLDAAPTLGAMESLDMVATDGTVIDREAWPGPRALRGDFVRNLELEIRNRKTGRFVNVEVSTTMLSCEPGEPKRIVITTHDLTERKRAEVDANLAQKRLELVVASMNDGVIVQGIKGEQLHWNRAALEMLEMEQRHDLEKTLAEFRAHYAVFTPEGAPLPQEQWPASRIMHGEELHGLEVSVRRLDRDWTRMLRIGGAKLVDASGEGIIFMTMTDVTARRSAERQLQQLNGELEQRVSVRTAELRAKSKELESFCYSVSHDLKAPLRAIDGYSRLLLDECGEMVGTDAWKFIGNVRAATVQMNTLIDDLLAYSQQDRRTMLAAQIRLRPFVAAKVKRLTSDLAQVRIELDVEDVVVSVDRDGIAMALRNLIENAVKFSARSKPPMVTIRSRTQGDRCVLSVQDNGIGFDMRYGEKIFEIFQRLQRAEDYPGTGVGLALVRKAMERMGGRAWADSAPGQGATFYLELQIASGISALDRPL